MSTIYDHAVRALLPVMGETGEDGYSLAYCCPPEPACRHTSCSAVHALDAAGLLWRRPPHECDFPPGSTASDLDRYTCPDCHTEWVKRRHNGLGAWHRSDPQEAP